MNPDTLITEARARIIWGESPSSVRDFLTTNGFSPTEADVQIKNFRSERNAEIRKIGFRNALIGAALIAGAGIVLYLSFKYLSAHNTGYYGSQRGVGGIIGLSLIGVFYGLWKLVNGIVDLVRPQSEDESIPDLSE